MTLEQLTIGEIALGGAFIVGLITSIKYLKSHLVEWVQDAVKEPFEEIENKLKELTVQIDEVGLDSQKNFLVAQLAEAERGVAWDEVERERFWEQYDKYQSRGGNSYIKDKVDKMKLERKI